MNAQQWIAAAKITPHPRNLRVGRPEKVDVIAQSMRENGYRLGKPMLVRTHGDGFQVIGGHSRLTAAQESGLEHVYCVVEEMDDEAAILRIAEDNLNDPPTWYEGCLYISDNAEKASKKGLSRGALVKALTGKEGAAADSEGRRRAAAGAVIRALISQAVNVDSLLDSESAKTNHLVEINSLPESAWPAAVDLMLEHGWSVKDTQAAVERIKSVLAARPAWLKSATPLTRIAIEPSFAKTVLSALSTLSACWGRLPESATIYREQETDETKEIDGREFKKRIAVPSDFAPRAKFEADMAQVELTSAKEIEAAYRTISQYIDQHAHAVESWVPVLTDAEEKERAARTAELARLQDRNSFMPRLLQGDVVEQLRALPDSHFDLVCVDPPYNMDKAGWDSFGSGKDFATWARPWLKECQRVLKDSGAIYVFGINRMLSHLQHEMDGLGLHYRNWITWDTIQGAGGGLWVNRTEAILYYGKTAETFEDSDAIKLERHEENVREYKGREYFFKNPSNIWRFPCVDDKHPERTEHPTQKPTELIERIVRASSPVGGYVLDCFMGSGTTGVACMRARRHATGIDQSAQYIAIAQARFDATEVPAA